MLSASATDEPPYFCTIRPADAVDVRRPADSFGITRPGDGVGNPGETPSASRAPHRLLQL
jgi:hypothetical protein